MSTPHDITPENITPEQVMQAIHRAMLQDRPIESVDGGLWRHTYPKSLFGREVMRQLGGNPDNPQDYDGALGKMVKLGIDTAIQDNKLSMTGERYIYDCAEQGKAPHRPSAIERAKNRLKPLPYDLAQMLR